MRSDPEIVLLHGGALGDLVLSIQLCLQIPGARERGLTVISRVDPGGLSTCRPPIQRISSETVRLHQVFADPPQISPLLAGALSGKTIVNALDGPESTLHHNLQAVANPRSVFSIDPRPRVADHHIIEQWRSDLQRQSVEFECDRPETDYSIRPSEALRDRGRTLLRVENPILIHPGSGSPQKCWPLANFDALAAKLRNENVDVLTIIGPVEQERGGFIESAAIHSLSPTDLAACIAAARLYIGNDSGPTHVAALLGTPTLALFGPTRAAQWSPRGAHVLVLQGDPALPEWGLTAPALAAARELLAT